MGRMIDETNLMNLLYSLDDARHDLCYAIKKIPELPTVEAIPQAVYEARLKADMVAMLTEIQLEIEEAYCEVENDYDRGRNYGLFMTTEIIQQKINALKENIDGTISD